MLGYKQVGCDTCGVVATVKQLQPALLWLSHMQICLQTPSSGVTLEKR